MPIENLSTRVRIPRLGKIHLGVKSTTTKDGHPVEYPTATDYFVVPDEVKEVYGEQPKELDIMLPTEDPELFAPQYLKAYSLSQGLICRGNGVKAMRKIDLSTGAIVDSKSASWDWREVSCDPQECELYMKKSCRQIMNLLFLLPKVPGLGVYQVDTSSYHSIININSMVRLLKGVVGRCSMIPLTLVLRPQEVSPQGTTKKTVHVLDIRQDITLSELAKTAMLPPAHALMPEVTEEMPEDLYPVSVLQESESPPPTAEKPAPKTEERKPRASKKQAEGSAAGAQDIQAEADKIGPDYYNNVICPRIKITFKKDPAELSAKQVETVMEWMLGKPSDEARRAFLLSMKGNGFSGKEQVQEQLIKYTGKDRGWNKGDLDKTLIASRASQPAAEGDPEVEEFLEMNVGD